jgi:hypothetical protein
MWLVREEAAELKGRLSTLEAQNAELMTAIKGAKK